MGICAHGSQKQHECFVKTSKSARRKCDLQIFQGNDIMIAYDEADGSGPPCTHGGEDHAGTSAQLLARLDAHIERPDGAPGAGGVQRDYGGFMEDDLHVESRQCGFDLSALACGYVTKDSAHYLSERVKAALTAALAYLRAHQRPGGCVDLLSCNVASAPDTAFMINAVLNAWWLLERCEDRGRHGCARRCCA